MSKLHDKSEYQPADLPGNNSPDNDASYMTRSNLFQNSQDNEEISGFKINNTSLLLAKPKNFAFESVLSSPEKPGSFRQRWFGPLNIGSQRASILNLISGCIGSGVLGIPYILSHAGMILGLAMLIIGGLTSLWSMYLLGRLYRQFRIPKYSDMIFECFGSGISYIFDVIIIIYAFGTIISLEVNVMIIAQALWSNSPGSFLLTNKYFILITLAVLLLIPSSFKQIQSLKYLSFFVTSIIIYLVLVVLFETKNYYDYNKDNNQYYWFIFHLDTFTVWGTALFSYICHLVVMPVISELKNPTERRCKKAFTRAAMIEIMLYVILAGTGYISFAQNTPDVITNRTPIPGSKDVAMQIAQYCLFFSLGLGIPIRVNASRTVLLSSIKRIRGGIEPGNIIFAISTVFILGVPTFLAIMFENIQAIFSILGGSFGTLIMIFFPAMMYFKSQILVRNYARQPETANDKLKFYGRAKYYDSPLMITFHAAYMCFGLVMGFTATGLTLYFLINPQENQIKHYKRQSMCKQCVSNFQCKKKYFLSEINNDQHSEKNLVQLVYNKSVHFLLYFQQKVYIIWQQMQSKFKMNQKNIFVKV